MVDAFDVISLLSLGKPLDLMGRGCDEKGYIKEVEMEAIYISLVRCRSLYLLPMISTLQPGNGH